MLFEFQISTKDMDVNQEEFEDTKGRQSESVYRRRTDNTMAKRKSTKGQQEKL
jgi:hypothetical protein